MRSAFVLLAPALAASCLYLKPSDGGGQIEDAARRTPRPEGVALPEGYRIDVVATGLTYPTGVAFDQDSVPHVVEAGYSYGESFPPARLLRVDEETGRTTEIARGERHGWMGVDFADGAFYVAEAGITQPGRVLRITPRGEQTVLADGMPSLGDHHLNGPAVRDGYVYFGVGTATNSAVVGLDNWDFGWLKRFPDFHDIPCEDVVLRGVNFTTKNPFTEDPDDEVVTGAYQPFGTRTAEGQVVPGRVPCTGAVLRVPEDGGPVELVAWGFRNPFGLRFSRDGSLYVTDNGYDERGSRPVYGSADWLWRVQPGRFYGWPDAADGRLVSQARYGSREALPLNPGPPALLAALPDEPVPPAAYLGVHSSSDAFDFSTSEAFGHVGEAFIAQFGDQAPAVGKVWSPVGFKVVRVDPATGVVRTFAANHGEENGPASMKGGDGLERPVAARFSPDGAALYVVDFGVLLMDEEGSHPVPGTGVLWKISREGAPLASR